MSTLSVSQIQNTASATTNIVVNADGSVTLGLYRTTGVAPTPVQTGTLWYDVGGAGLVIWDGANWVGVGGGGGGVSAVTATAPLASSGGTTPDISLTGTIPILNGGTGATTVAGAQANLLPAQAGNGGKVLSTDGLGALSWIAVGGSGTVTNVTGTAPIAVATGTTTPVISANLATASDAATGTSATVLMTPQFAVPKDASGMTGAAILPSGTDLQRAAITTPVVGMQRFNTDSGYEEVYTGATLGWKRFSYVTDPSPALPDVTLSGATSLASSYICNNFAVSAGATLTSTGTGVVIRARGNVTIDASTWTLVGVRIGTVSGGPFPSNYFGQAGRGYGGGGIGAAPSGVGVTYSPYAQLGGSTGGTGTTATGGFVGTPGNAGGYVVIIAEGNITFNGVVTMDCSGANAIGGANSGCGGGSGGTIIIQTPLTLTTPATVTFNVSGGNGAAATAGGGGGGGGGGWVILQSGNLVDSSSKILTGGSGGAGTGPGSSGGGGGGNAGAGGASSSSAAGTAGSAGIFQTYGSPF